MTPTRFCSRFVSESSKENFCCCLCYSYADNDGANRNHVIGGLYPMFLMVWNKKNCICGVCMVCFDRGINLWVEGCQLLSNVKRKRADRTVLNMAPDGELGNSTTIILRAIFYISKSVFEPRRHEYRPSLVSHLTEVTSYLEGKKPNSRLPFLPPPPSFQLIRSH